MKNRLFKRILFGCTLITLLFSSCRKNNSVISKVIIEPEVDAIMTAKWNSDFQHVEYPKQWLDNTVSVKPGESIQAAIDAVSEAGGGVVYLKEGTYVLDSTLTLKSKTTIVGRVKGKRY